MFNVKYPPLYDIVYYTNQPQLKHTPHVHTENTSLLHAEFCSANPRKHVYSQNVQQLITKPKVLGNIALQSIVLIIENVQYRSTQT